MKRFRLLLILAGVAAALLVMAVAWAFNSRFQTWAVRRALAAQPGMQASVEQVSAGLKRVQLRGLHVEQNGVVLKLPSVEIELPVLSAAVSRNVAVSRLVAKGWILDMSKAAGASGPAPVPGSKTGALPALPQAAAQAFAGVFTQLQLPVDLSLDGLDLEGDVVLPESRGRTRVVLKGGGLGAKREGKFDLVADAALTDPQVNKVEIRGELVATMDTPRTFTGLSAKLNAAASGAKFPRGVKLSAELAATRAAAGETYSVAVVTDGQDILHVRADFPKDARRLEGTWKLDVRDADVAPFALGQPLPAFTAVGEGKFDADATFSAVHASGRLNATADRLHVVRAELAALGELKISADFDLGESAGVITVQKIEAAISGAEPVATVRSLQSFEFRPATGAVRPTDAAGDLLGVVLQGVPVAWVQPLAKSIEVSGGRLRGELVATPRGGGVSVRSTKALTVDNFGLAQAGQSLVHPVDLSLGLAADYTPQGWQAEVSTLTARSGDATLLTLNTKVGQLAGADQPLKATGRLDANLPATLAQPALVGKAALAGGTASVDFAASIATKQEVQAKVAFKDLAVTVDGKAEKLPVVSADLRADIAADGKITFNVPLLIERNERKSDLTIAGSVGPEKDKARAIDAQVTSTNLVVNDARMFAAIAPPKTEKAPEVPKPSDSARAPWAGVHGSVALQLKRVIYSDTFEASNVAGRLRIDAGTLKLEGLQAGLGDSGRANVNGTVTFNPSAPQRYALAADFAVREFDPGPLFRALNPKQPPTVEGKFDVSSKLAARGMKLGDLAVGAGGDFQLTSKGGVFRGLPVNLSHLVESSSKIAGWISSAGTAISSITGKKEYEDIGNKAQAIAEFGRGVHPIPYDQLSVTLSRDAALNTTLKNFTLISPEVRLTGTGTTLHRPDGSLLDDPLAMEFKLRARGRQAHLLKYLGAIEPQPDDFGYAACTIPLKIGGTLGKPDASETSTKLAALALEKAGVTDKAADLVNRIFGGGKGAGEPAK